MPSSRFDPIPSVCSVVSQIDPRSILDVGTGFGKWGLLFREYLDIVKSGKNPGRYAPEGWLVRIDGIEAYAQYLTPVHEYVYDEMYVGDALQILPRLGKYELIFLGDVIEHFEKSEGEKLICEALDHAESYVVLTTPRHDTGQGALCGNELETHKSVWKGRDFRRLGDAKVLTVPGDVLMAIYRKPGRRPVRPKAKRPPSLMKRMLRRARTKSADGSRSS